MPRLYVPIGLPGSGKSTWTKQLLESPDCLRVSSDDIRQQIHPGVQHDPEANDQVFAEFHRQILSALFCDRDAIADATNLQASARAQLQGIARPYKASVHYLFFTNISEAVMRNSHRPAATHIAEDIMMKFIERYEHAHHDILTESYDTLTYISSVL